MVRNWKILLGDLLFEYGFLSCEQVAHSVSHEAKDFDVERIAVFFFILHLIRDKLIGTCEPFSLEIVFAFKVVGYTEVSKYELKGVYAFDKDILGLQVAVQESLGVHD